MLRRKQIFLILLWLDYIALRFDLPFKMISQQAFHCFKDYENT